MQSNTVFEADWNSAVSPERLFLESHSGNNDCPNITPDKQSFVRTSLKNIRRATQIFIIATIAETPFILNREVEQPTPIVQHQGAPYVQYVSVNGDGLPSPDDPINDIIDSLDSDERYQAFLKKNSSGYFPITPWTFLGSYAYSPQSLQEHNWKAPCNGFAEFACEVGTRHGKKMYLLGLWPDGERTPSNEGDTLEEHKHRSSWHLVAFYKLQNKYTQEFQYVIFDNDTVTTLEPGLPLSSYAAEKHYNVIVPMGGIAEWKRVPDDWRAKIARHVGTTIEEDEIQTTIGMPIQSISIAKK